MKGPTRAILLMMGLGCAGLIGAALYLQHAENLLPCPLCVVQRVAYWLVGVLALLALLHDSPVALRRGYGAFMALVAFIGAAVALRQAWLIRHPEAFECGISPEERFLNALPIARWWPAMFEANGDCADATWTFASLYLPDWSALCLLLLGGLAIHVLLAERVVR